jgi:hypothetical protein
VTDGTKPVSELKGDGSLIDTMNGLMSRKLGVTDAAQQDELIRLFDATALSTTAVALKIKHDNVTVGTCFSDSSATHPSAVFGKKLVELGYDDVHPVYVLEKKGSKLVFKASTTSLSRATALIDAGRDSSVVLKDDQVIDMEVEIVIEKKFCRRIRKEIIKKTVTSFYAVRKKTPAHKDLLV